MRINSRLGLFLLVPLLYASQIPARQNHSAARPGDRIYLDVVVSPTSVPPVSGLQQKDFTVLDNKVPQTIASFEAVHGRQAPVEVVLVFDVVNVESREASMERGEISRFLKADGGRLDYPTAVALLTDKGLQFQGDFSQNGHAIRMALDHYKIPLGSIGRDADDVGLAQRFQISFQGFAELLARERDKPGRKLFLCVSPGWPPLLGLENMRDSRLREEVFGNIVEISTQLREGQITVYSVDPSAIGDIAPGLTDPPTIHLRPSGRKVHIEGASKPSDVRTDSLTLGAIAAQSGGLVLIPGNDLAAELEKCLADAVAYYEISFDPAITDRSSEYHNLEIRIAKPGLTARTRQGYYSQPWPEKFAAKSEKLGGTEDDRQSPKPGTGTAERADTSDQSFYANAIPYIDLPLAKLVERIPELKTLQPVPDQQELAMILEKMGGRVDDFIRNVGDLIANEDVTQEKLNANGKIKAMERVQDN